MDRHAALAELAHLVAPADSSVEALGAFARRRAELLAEVAADARPLEPPEAALAAAAARAGAAVVTGAEARAAELLRQLGRLQRAPFVGAAAPSGAPHLHRFG